MMRYRRGDRGSMRNMYRTRGKDTSETRWAVKKSVKTLGDAPNAYTSEKSVVIPE
jgi:hypothetical protein